MVFTKKLAHAYHLSISPCLISKFVGSLIKRNLVPPLHSNVNCHIIGDNA